MRKVRREELVDYVTWAEESLPVERPLIMAIKEKRRIHVGPVLTFLFENADTVRYQVQEMMRTEQMVKESAIQHELDTYNELLGTDPGTLGCVLLIEITDKVERVERLREWLGMPDHWYVRLPGGRRVGATYDPRQVGDDRLSSVQYLQFAVGGVAPVAVGCDFPAYTYETALSDAQRAALAEDLAE
jgi:Protein of unknown function (DUF3501)